MDKTEGRDKDVEGPRSGPPRVLVGALGGTIAMRSGTGGATPTETAESLVQTVPCLAQVAEVTSRTLRNLPSASLDIPTLLGVLPELEAACAEGAAGVVLTQGTDTLEEVAYLFDLVWGRSEPLVLTGAMRTADAVGADGPANLLAAVTVAASPDTAGRGCLVVMNDEVHHARQVRKMHTTSLGAFASPATGPVGRVTEGRVSFSSPPGRRRSLEVRPAATTPRVGLVRLALGDDTTGLEALGEAYDALVIEAFGAGHVPSWWTDALARLAAAKPVVLASRTGAGCGLTGTYDFAGAESGLLRSGLIPAGDLDGLKARILLTVSMMASDRHAGAVEIFHAHATQGSDNVTTTLTRASVPGEGGWV